MLLLGLPLPSCQLPAPAYQHSFCSLCSSLCFLALRHTPLQAPPSCQAQGQGQCRGLLHPLPLATVKHHAPAAGLLHRSEKKIEIGNPPQQYPVPPAQLTATSRGALRPDGRSLQTSKLPCWQSSAFKSSLCILRTPCMVYVDLVRSFFGLGCVREKPRSCAKAEGRRILVKGHLLSADR